MTHIVQHVLGKLHEVLYPDTVRLRRPEEWTLEHGMLHCIHNECSTGVLIGLLSNLKLSSHPFEWPIEVTGQPRFQSGAQCGDITNVIQSM